MNHLYAPYQNILLGSHEEIEKDLKLGINLNNL